MTKTEFNRHLEKYFRLVQKDAKNPEKESIAFELFFSVITYEFGYLQDAKFSHDVTATNDGTFDSYTMRVQRKDA